MKGFESETVKQLLKSRAVTEAELKLEQAKLHGLSVVEVKHDANEKILDLERRIKLIDSLFSMLNADEIFVIQRHLMDGIDWYRIVKEYNDTWGQEHEKTVRSFQIYQTKALRKIADYINKGEDVELFLSMLPD